MPFVWDHSLEYVYRTFFSCELCLYGQQQRKITPFPFHVLSEKEWYILDSMICSWYHKGQHCKNALNMILITAGWRLFCYCCCCLFCFGVFFKQSSPELVNCGVTFPWCSNSVKSWTAQIAVYQPNTCSTSFFVSSSTTPLFQTPWNVSFSWQCLRCSGGSSVEWRCQWSPCAA